MTKPSLELEMKEPFCTKFQVDGELRRRAEMASRISGKCGNILKKPCLLE